METTQITVAQAVNQVAGLLQHEKIPANLHHYTNAGGLFGILRSGELFASAVGYSNDRSEGKYATSLGLKILHEHSLFLNPTHKLIAKFTDRLFQSPRCAWEDGYVISFCERNDVLSQWRAYGGLSSYSLCFRNLKPNDFACDAGEDIRIVRVSYKEADQERDLKDALSNAVKWLEQDTSDNNQKLVSLFMYVYVTQWACSVKHPAFAEEQEWRITIFPKYRDLTPQQLFYGELEQLAKMPEVREHRGRLLPYVVCKPKTGALPLASITVGPSPTQDVDLKALNLLLAKFHSPDISATTSSIPLRS